MYRWEITRAALAQRVFAIVRGDTFEQVTSLADSLLTAGIEALEVSLTSPCALETIGMLRRETGADAVIGAGTVLDAESARAALDAGARFLVAPSLDVDVIRTGHRYGVPVFPGVATPTEMVRALESGADALKLFPAVDRSPSWLRAVRAALPQAPLLPTGGVTVETAPEWIAAGAAACGMGSDLAGRDRAGTARRVAELLQRLEEAADGASADAGDAGEDRRTAYGTDELSADSSPDSSSNSAAGPASSPAPERTTRPAAPKKTAKATKTAKPAKAAKSAKSAKTTRSAGTAKRAESAKSNQSAKSAQSARSAKPAENGKPARTGGGGNGGRSTSGSTSGSGNGTGNGSGDGRRARAPRAAEAPNTER